MGVSLSLNGPAHFWFLDFAAPAAAPLAPGIYEGATRFPFQASSTARRARSSSSVIPV